IRQQLGFDLPLKAHFDHPELADFARQLAGLAPAAALTLPSPEALPRADRSQPLPLSWAQQRLWFLDQLEGQSQAYHIAGAFHLHGPLDTAAVQAALDALLARHEVLRMNVITRDGEGWGQVRPEAGPDSGFALRCLDLAALSGRRRAAEMSRQLAGEVARPFDLANDPLIRGLLLKLTAQHHVLCVVMHHIVSDGWSVGLLRQEFAALYAAFCQGQMAALPPLPLQYADYALWQRQHLSGARLEAQLAYWRQQLQGAPAVLALPTDRPRPAQRRHEGGSLPLLLEATLTRDLRQLARAQGVTLYMVLYAGLALLLARLSQQEEVVIGTPVANRTHAALEPLIGFFANTLALRLRLTGVTDTTALLQEVKRLTLAAYAHQEAPFEQVVEAVQPVRSLSHSPLFQVMLSWQNLPPAGVPAAVFEGLDGLQIVPCPLPEQAAQFDLLLEAYEAPAEDGAENADVTAATVIRGAWHFARDLFDEATIARWLGHLVHLLRGMVAQPQLDPMLLPLLDEPQQRVLAGFNPPPLPYPLETTLDALFEAQVARCPEAVALCFEGLSLTYGQLDERANRLAHALRQRGVGPDERVAICVVRGLEMVVGLLAILKAGGAYVPLDPSYPPERLGQMLEDAQPCLVLTQQALEGLLHSAGGHLALPVLLLDGLAQVPLLVSSSVPWADCPADSPGQAHTRLLPQHLAYVIFTSGSTGRPKGVMIEHRAVVNRLLWMQEAYRLTPRDTVLQKTPFSFDVSVWEFFWPLINGATLVLARPQGHQDPHYLQDLIEASDITTLHFVPSMLQVFLAQLAPGRCQNLRHLVCSGEELSVALQDQCLERLPGTRLHNLYGPTEAAIDVTFWECRHDPQQLRVPIGRPIANLRLYVLDAHRQPVPIGVSGELYIGGVGVARGYLNRPELTAERFITDPFTFSTDPKDRLYKTGDLARWRADGVLEYLGRNDFQLKIRGFRIEPGEVEAQLVLHPAVQESVVLARPLHEGHEDRQLVAYLTASPGHSPEAATLREWLKERLPEYLRPAAYVLLAQWPLTANGKLDRAALPAPQAALPSGTLHVPPQGALECALAQIWQEVLKAGPVGRHDHFFDLGGHSLLAVQVSARVRQLLGRELPLRAFFETPGLAALARRLQEETSAAETAPIPLADRSLPLPLSWSQQRLWFLDQLEGQSQAYHIAGALRLEGILDPQAVQWALDTIIERHEVLRTRFDRDDQGQPCQHIVPMSRFALRHLDLSRQPARQRAAALQRLIDEEAATPFDLTHDPLIRGLLVRSTPQQHLLCIVMHHIVSDGWSVGLMMQEFAALYARYHAHRPGYETGPGESNGLPPLPLQYADYAAWQRQQEASTRQTALAYWQQRLTGAPALLELPTDRPRPAQQSYAGASVPLSLSPPLTARLKDFARHHELTLFMTLYAGFALLLGRLAGQQDVVIGVPVANRPRQELESLIGFFTNTLALRLSFDPAEPLHHLLTRLKTDTLEAFHHQDVPFEQIVEAVHPARSLAHSPLFQVLFALQNLPQNTFELPGLRLTEQEITGHSTQFDLSLLLHEHDGGIEGTLHYACDLFEPATMTRWLGHFVTLLTALVDDPEARGNIASLPLLTTAETRQLLTTFNPRPQPRPQPLLIIDHITTQARRTPAAIAVIADGDDSDGDNGGSDTPAPRQYTLSYAELDRRSNRLAHQLRALGAGPGQRVGL
ncbi:MAG: amino acid adenylation domain-containing protein, partial [Sterolibacterium sp.]|nr:amino acid adenylation domain-containing protein [Sterolibacterium sp.]